jgi:hypothetical protein
MTVFETPMIYETLENTIDILDGSAHQFNPAY